MMVLGLQIFHSRSFLQGEGIEISAEISEELERLRTCQEPMFFIQIEDLTDLCGKYEKFTEETIISEFGKTAQF